MAHEDNLMWQKPQHHHDIDGTHEHVHWVELFYDLVHVVSIFLLGTYLSDHYSWAGFGAFTLMFAVLWFAWGEISIYNSIYVSTDVTHRIFMSLAILTVMFMAASIPSFVGKGAPYFMIAFAANRFIIAALYARARRTGADSTSMCSEQIRNFCIFGVVFVIAAFLPKPLNYYAFAGGLIATQLSYMLPGFTVLRHDRFRPRWGHMSERFALLTLIVLGESFFKLVVTLAEKGIYKVSPEVFVNFSMGGLSTFVLCWLYFEFAANAKTKDENTPTLVKYWIGHLFLMFFAVVVGVGLTGSIKVGLWDPYPIKYATLGCVGLAGYLICLWVIQTIVEPRDINRYSTLGVRAFGVIMAIITYFCVPYIPTIVGYTLFSIALFSQIVVPLYRSVRSHSAAT